MQRIFVSVEDFHLADISGMPRLSNIPAKKPPRRVRSEIDGFSLHALGLCSCDVRDFLLNTVLAPSPSKVLTALAFPSQKLTFGARLSVFPTSLAELLVRTRRIYAYLALILAFTSFDCWTRVWYETAKSLCLGMQQISASRRAFGLPGQSTSFLTVLSSLFALLLRGVNIMWFSVT